jgi:hypothetical protein
MKKIALWARVMPSIRRKGRTRCGPHRRDSVAREGRSSCVEDRRLQAVRCRHSAHGRKRL